MRTGPCRNRRDRESGVANMIEYLMISGVIMALFIVMLLLVNTNIMEDPANRLIYVSFTDIGNGVSTRIVDLYAIAPLEGDITTHFDIPDEIVGRGYVVELGSSKNSADQDITVSRGYLESHIAIAGIATTYGVGGNTTGAGLNIISYNSSGVFV
jgi:hypothetical protein